MVCDITNGFSEYNEWKTQVTFFVCQKVSINMKQDIAIIMYIYNIFIKKQISQLIHRYLYNIC